MSKHTRILNLSSVVILTLVILAIGAASVEDFRSASGLFAYASLISFIRGLASPIN